jgi:hypothetical protein
MSRTLVVGLVLAAALLLPVAAQAHGGHVHKVMGTVTAVTGDKVTVKTVEGKTVTVVLNTKTRITQGKVKADAQALKAGIRLVAEGAEDKGILTATVVQVAVAR